MTIAYRKPRTILYAFALLFAFIIIYFTNPQQVNAAAVTDIYIEDQADIFTPSQEEALTKEMKRLQEKYDMDFVILTTNGRGGYTAKQVIDNYVDFHCDLNILSEDVVISLRDVNDRWIEIRGYGKGETYITDSRVDRILDNMTPDLLADRYYDAYSVFLDNVDTYLNRHPNPLTWTWVQILIGLAIGGMITASMVYHSKGKITTHFRTYLDKENSGLVARRDIYIRTTVSRTKIQSSSSGGGRSGGGRSSSGGGRRI